MPVLAPNAFSYPVSYIPPPLSPMVGGAPTVINARPRVDTNAVPGSMDPSWPTWFGWGAGGLIDESWTGEPYARFDLDAGDPPDVAPRPAEAADASEDRLGGHLAESPAAPAAGRGMARVPAPAQTSPADDRIAELMAEGIEAFALGRYDAAGSIFLRASMADRANVDSLLAYAVARFATGDYANTAMAVRRAVRMQPEVVNAVFDIRDRYGRAADFERHLVALHVYIRQRVDRADGWLTLGFVRHFAGQRDLAREAFAALRELAPEDADVAEAFLAARPAVSEP